MDEVLELEYDTLAALTTIREWINSFVPINRLPVDVLSTISTHLPPQKDRFHATFVCRHWRRTLLQHAGLWSHICLAKGEVYVKTLLKRAKGSPLSILASGMDPVDTITLLPPYAKQITDLEFANMDISRFSKIISGPLPFLRTLNLDTVHEIDRDVPLFSDAVGLKEFRLHSERSPSLSHFVFPNLTSFELSVPSLAGDGSTVRNCSIFWKPHPCCERCT